MTEKSPRRDALIAKVIGYIHKQLPEDQHQLISDFITHYYAIVAYEDLQERSIMDLSGAVLSHWHLIYQRQPGERKVRVYNPHYETDGWQSTHSIIDISQDDMPFLVDTARMEITRRGINIHFAIHPGGIRLVRDQQYRVIKVLPRDAVDPDSKLEAAIHFEINRQNETSILNDIKTGIEKGLADVARSVKDWHAMSDHVRDAIADLEKNPPSLAAEEVQEAIKFLQWLADDNFTFLGYREYELIGESEKRALHLVPNSGLGVLSDTTKSQEYRYLTDMTDEVKTILLSPQVLIIAKTNTKATVHRNSYTDYVGVKRFNAQGELIGERRFVGLFTSVAYHSNPQDIPFLRHKVTQVLKRSNINIKSHAGKALLAILETFPRDDLFQADIEELTDISLGILHLQERSKVRLFVRKDIYGRYMSCLVYVPKDRYNTENRNQIEKILQRAFDGVEVSFSTMFGESVLARIHYVIRIDPEKKTPEYNVKELEQKLIEVTRLWRDELSQILLEHYGEERGTALYKTYEDAFPSSYRDDFDPRIGVADIKYIEKVLEGEKLCMGVYRPLSGSESNLHFKIFQANESIPLSDVIPIMENMGLRVLDERPYEVYLGEDKVVWINDFDMVLDRGEELNTTLIKHIFKEAFAKIWFKEAQNDGFNRLILTALLSWREVALLRAYAKYLRQAAFTFSQNYIERAFHTYPELAKMLVQLFKLRFDPALASNSAAEIEAVDQAFEKALDKVVNLDEERIFRCYHALIYATLRTNYFQKDNAGNPKTYMCFKFASAKVPDLPLPKPLFEIFTYATDFEGIHLRSGKVARGGLRWSDRREDFRTEILGLMKAQSVKNSVIVPAGAKGGFVIKRPPLTDDRDALMQKVVACYQNFIRSLLDVTDNIVDGNITPPIDVVRYDTDDPYLVVAADKGTATFSDIANQISEEYNFWLGDAFASGGSNGYDHKKMAITARGAWESVKRHFQNLNIDTQTTDFTVVGIGDMSGDVFGNGMLLSEHIRLIAAFNHQHIFLDPNPDAQKSFKERKRLFDLPRSGWNDYNTDLISEGGGIFNRKDKSIKLSPQIKQMLDLEQDYIVPDLLISKLLTAKFDLLWNGGIGTYVKASTETNAEVGDKSNDGLRINGCDLQCRVVGEGGNLGFTQLARVEFALKGGLIYTDFIDNSAGVDCSDHEVNLKILLNNAVSDNKLSVADRNKLLANLRDEVAELVLKDNISQTKAIDLEMTQSLHFFDLTKRYIHDMDRLGYLNRTIEFLPNDKQLTERKAQNVNLTSPEIAILLAYAKNLLKQEIKSTSLVNDPIASQFLKLAFPKIITEKFPAEMEKHQLRSTIIATQVSSLVINEMGSMFVYRLIDETGATTEAIIKAYLIAREVFDASDLSAMLESLDTSVNTQVKNQMIVHLSRLLRRATRWFLRNYHSAIDIEQSIRFYDAKVTLLHKIMPEILVGRRKEINDVLCQQYIEAGVPRNIALKFACLSPMFSALDIIQAAETVQQPLESIATCYFLIGNKLNLAWLREQLNAQTMETNWEALSLSALRDDVDRLQRVLTISITQHDTSANTIEDRINSWIAKYTRIIERWHTVESNIRASGNISLTMLFVGLRELMDLAQAASQTQDEFI